MFPIVPSARGRRPVLWRVPILRSTPLFGGEAPSGTAAKRRALFDALAGGQGESGGLLGNTMTYRGINLPRLFEGTWITLVWPRWFQETSGPG